MHNNNLLAYVRWPNKKSDFYYNQSCFIYFNFNFDTLGWNKVILARLLMGNILSKNIDKIIYLDGDTIVRGCLGELWNLDMKNKIIGMSIEPTANKKRKEKLGLKEYPYYLEEVC